MFVSAAQKDHCGSNKVADMACAAGELWRTMSDDKKKSYEEQSSGSKASDCSSMGMWGTGESHAWQHRTLNDQ